MSGPTLNEEILDLREIILILWRRKWLILSISLLMGAVIFLVNRTLVPKQYQATAYITITDPTTRGEIEPYGFPEIAESDVVIQVVFLEMGINSVAEKESYEFSSSIKGRGQILLSVTSEDPVLAAEAANYWAEVLVIRLNDIYVTTEEKLNSLEEQTAAAEEIWKTAQTELEDFLSESNLQVYPAQIEAAQADLEDTLREVESNHLLLSDLQVLAAQIEGLDPANGLPPGIELSLINLQAQVTGPQVGLPAEMTIGEPYFTSAQAIDFLEGLESALESQDQELVGEAASLEDEIANLVFDQEEERNQEARLKIERDQAQSSYVVLLAYLEEGKIHQTQEFFHIKISAEAVPVDEAISTHLVINTGFAAISAGLLTILGSLFQAWWVGKDDK